MNKVNPLAPPSLSRGPAGAADPSASCAPALSSLCSCFLELSSLPLDSPPPVILVFTQAFPPALRSFAAFFMYRTQDVELLVELVSRLTDMGFITDKLTMPSGTYKPGEPQSYMGICKLEGKGRLHRRVDIKVYPTYVFRVVRVSCCVALRRARAGVRSDACKMSLISGGK